MQYMGNRHSFGTDRSSMFFGSRKSKSVVSDFNDEYFEQQQAYENDQDDPFNFPIDKIVNDFRLYEYSRKKDAKRNASFAKKFDVLKLLNAVQSLKVVNGKFKLHNMYLKDFLQRNAPKMLAGLPTLMNKMTGRRAFGMSTILSRRREGSIKSSSSLQSIQSQLSFSSVAQDREEREEELYLNEHARTDMIEKLAADVQERMKKFEARGQQRIKKLRGQIQEQELQRKDTAELALNFQLHFLRDAADLEFLETASARKIESTFRHFIAHWLECTRSLTSTIRLRNKSIHNNVETRLTNIGLTSDLNIITVPDYELQFMKRKSMQQSLEDKNHTLVCLKELSGRTAMEMGHVNHVLEANEEKLKKLKERIRNTTIGNQQLDKIAYNTLREYMLERKKLNELKKVHEVFASPTIYEYIEHKNDLDQLQKEEKVLRRKIYITQMKIANKLNQIKRNKNLDF